MDQTFLVATGVLGAAACAGVGELKMLRDCSTREAPVHDPPKRKKEVVSHSSFSSVLAKEED